VILNVAISIVFISCAALSVVLGDKIKNLFSIFYLFLLVSAMSGAEVSYHSIIGKPALAFNNTMKLGR
jgi:hypothetical protein